MYMLYKLCVLFPINIWQSILPEYFRIGPTKA